ncbi:hypothetical protein OG539_19040 [Actinacidiphila glaucinigra]|uniref:hypothetical protein n=1 Tax=Actinacidiphila glaucinigra TaxID=235986 RepID=UPI002DD9CAA8|nr:hypothetical protein [Actinacidiphila glaucinigra]WSD61699.1 hypothetical protein OIE69_23735 [Actinacidiphila glaucinigra]
MTHTVVRQHQAMAEFRRLRLLDPVGAKACAAAVRDLARGPRTSTARAPGGSGYRPDAETVTVLVLKVGRVG